MQGKWRYFVPVQVERESFHDHTSSLGDAPLQRAVELRDAQPETAVRIDVRQNPQQDANRHVQARRRDHPLQLIQSVDRNQAPMTGCEPEKLFTFGRAGDHHILASNTTADGVHQLRRAAHIDPSASDGTDRQPARGLIGLLPEINLAINARPDQGILNSVRFSAKHAG